MTCGHVCESVWILSLPIISRALQNKMCKMQNKYCRCKTNNATRDWTSCDWARQVPNESLPIIKWAGRKIVMAWWKSGTDLICLITCSIMKALLSKKVWRVCENTSVSPCVKIRLDSIKIRLVASLSNQTPFSLVESVEALPSVGFTLTRGNAWYLASP